MWWDYLVLDDALTPSSISIPTPTGSKYAAIFKKIEQKFFTSPTHRRFIMLIIYLAEVP